MSIHNISDSELELMKIIWLQNGKALLADIMNQLSEQGNNWQNNTVITLLSRLVEKGLLKTNKIGRKNEYRAIVSEKEYQTSQTQTLVDKLYEGNAKGLLLTLLQNDMLSDEDCKELRHFWEQESE